MNVLITGATGLIGGEAVRQAIADPAVQSVVLLTRRASSFTDPRVTEIIHTDFTNYERLASVFQNVDACLWCLGISQTRVSKNEYFRITHDYVVAGAKAMLAANPAMAFLFVSGQGADSHERSPLRFARVKGQAENALLNMHAQQLFIVRPGGIVASTKSKSDGGSLRLELLAGRILAAVFPWSVITTADLAKCMLHVVRHGSPTRIISHWQLKNLVRVKLER